MSSATAMMQSALILLVEDEPLISMATEDALIQGGFKVIVATDGVEALALLQEQAVHGLVTDIRLGNSPDGWEVARQARAHQPDIPVVYCTGDSAFDYSSRAVPNSAVVQKPYAAPQVVASLSMLLAQAAAARATSQHPPAQD